MERPYSEDAGVSSPINLDFGYLANSLALLLEAAKTELEHDQEAAKTSLATARSSKLNLALPAKCTFAPAQ